MARLFIPTRAAVLADLHAHPPRLEPGEHDQMARYAHERARLPLPFPKPEDLANALELLVLWNAFVSGCCHGSLFDDVIVVSPSKLRGRAALAVVHEIAHHLLEARVGVYTHGDVWLLTLCLAVPGNRLGLARQAVSLPWPRWVVGLRGRLERELARAA